MYIIGIDNGLHGGIAVLHGGDAVDVGITPTVRTGKGTKRDYLPAEMAHLIKTYTAGRLADTHCYLEWAQAYPKQGAVSNFTTGRGFGIWLGILGAFDIPVTPVRPRKWQRELFAGMSGDDTKAKSVLRASQLFPRIALVPEGCRNKHHGMSDALLIAEYGRRQLNGRQE